MSKYEEALNKIKASYIEGMVSEEQEEMCNVLQEAISKAEMYDELSKKYLILEKAYELLRDEAREFEKENKILRDGIKAIRHLFGLNKGLDDNDNPVISYYFPEDDEYYEIEKGENYDVINKMLEVLKNE